MDELQAAMLRIKLADLTAESQRRAEVAAAYSAAISNPKVLTPTVAEGCTHVWHQYVVRCKDRDALREHLSRAGIPTDIHYATPPHLQPCYEGRFSGPYPITEQLAAEVLSLPIANITPEEAKEISLIINEF